VGVRGSACAWECESACDCERVWVCMVCMCMCGCMGVLRTRVWVACGGGGVCGCVGVWFVGEVRGRGPSPSDSAARLLQQQQTHWKWCCASAQCTALSVRGGGRRGMWGAAGLSRKSNPAMRVLATDTGPRHQGPAGQAPPPPPATQRGRAGASPPPPPQGGVRGPRQGHS
jgi:hypothetical protein